METLKKGKSDKPSFSCNRHVSANSAYRKNYNIYTTLRDCIQNIEDNSSINSSGVVTYDIWSTESDLGIQKQQL